jgi:hypothetical protein
MGFIDPRNAHTIIMQHTPSNLPHQGNPHIASSANKNRNELVM